MDNMQEQIEEISDAVNDNGQPTDTPPAVEAVTTQALPEAEPAAPREEAIDLGVEIERLKAEVAANLDGWQRARAEFVNYRRRSEADRGQLVFLTGVKIIEKLLPVIDDLNRALTNLPDDLRNHGWIDGVQLTRRKLIGVLDSEGVTLIPVTPGDVFDPTLHEALSHEESDEFKEGQIIGEVQPGYRIGDRVLRPSLVRVAR